MKTNHSKRILALGAGLLLTAASVLAQGKAPPGAGNGNRPETAPPAVRPSGPNENASENAKAVHAIIQQFQAQREQYLAERRALLEKLKTATEEERKALLEELRADNQSRAEEERTLGKQIREEMKRLREERKAGG